MNQLTVFQCPKCHKVYITQIGAKQVMGGIRPILMIPGETCTGVITQAPDGSDVICGFEFSKLQVESFTIPVNEQVMKQLDKQIQIAKK
jgi:hypothetical protein